MLLRKRDIKVHAITKSLYVITKILPLKSVCYYEKKRWLPRYQQLIHAY